MGNGGERGGGKNFCFLAAHPEIVSLAPLSFLLEEKRGLFLLIGGAHLILVQGPFSSEGGGKSGEKAFHSPFFGRATMHTALMLVYSTQD